MKYKVKFIKNLSIAGEVIYEEGQIYEIDPEKYELVKDECEVIEKIEEDKPKGDKSSKGK